MSVTLYLIHGILLPRRYFFDVWRGLTSDQLKFIEDDDDESPSSSGVSSGASSSASSSSGSSGQSNVKSVPTFSQFEETALNFDLEFKSPIKSEEPIYHYIVKNKIITKEMVAHHFLKWSNKTTDDDHRHASTEYTEEKFLAGEKPSDEDLSIMIEGTLDDYFSEETGFDDICNDLMKIKINGLNVYTWPKDTRYHGYRFVIGTKLNEFDAKEAITSVIALNKYRLEELDELPDITGVPDNVTDDLYLVPFQDDDDEEEEEDGNDDGDDKKEEEPKADTK